VVVELQWQCPSMFVGSVRRQCGERYDKMGVFPRCQAAREAWEAGAGKAGGRQERVRMGMSPRV